MAPDGIVFIMGIIFDEKIALMLKPGLSCLAWILLDECQAVGDKWFMMAVMN